MPEPVLDRSPAKEKRYGPARPGLIADERESRSQEPRNKRARHQRVDIDVVENIDVVEIGGVAGLALHRAAGSARMRAPLSVASYRDNSRKSQPSICGGLLAELSADKNTMRDPACVLCGHVAMVAGHQVAYLDRLNLPAMFSQQVTDVGALLVEP